MKTRTLLITALLLAMDAGAQTTPDESARKAKETLDKVSAVNQKLKTFEARFSFTLNNQQEHITEKYDGNILVSGEKYRLTLMNAVTYFDGTTQAVWLKEANEVNLSAPDEDDEDSLNPAKIFNIYSHGFKFKYLGDRTEEGVPVCEIDLYPEDRSKPYSRIRLTIDRSKMQIRTLVQQGKDGNTYTVKVLSLNANATAKASDFSFDKAANPQVQVVDLR